MIGVRIIMRITKGGDLDDIPAISHVNYTKTATDYARITKQAMHLFRAGIGGHVKILGVTVEQKISHGTAYQVSGITRLVQSVKNLQGIFADIRARDSVIRSRDNIRGMVTNTAILCVVCDSARRIIALP